MEKLSFLQKIQTDGFWPSDLGGLGVSSPPPPAGVLEVGAPKENVSAPKCIQIGLK